MKKALFVALWVAVGITAMAQVTLSFNPDKGEKYNYKMEMIQKIGQNIMGQQMDMDQTMVFEYNMNIVDKNATEIVADFEYKNILYSLSSAMLNMKYDSKNPSASTSEIDGIMAKILGVLLNKKFTVTMDTDGTVKSVTGVDAIMSDLLIAVGEDAMGKQMAEGMKDQFGDEAIKKSFEQSFKIYPSGNIKVGDSWTINQNAGNAGMEMNVNIKYTLKSISGGKAMADIESTVEGMGGQIKGTQTGTIEFDLKSGLPIGSAIVQKVKGTVSAQGMEVPMDITSNVNTTVVKE